MPNFLEHIGLSILRAVGDTPERHAAYRGAGSSMGAQLAAGTAIAVPSAARAATASLPNAARAGASVISSAFTPAIREFGAQTRRVAPLMGAELADSSSMAFLGELQSRNALYEQESTRVSQAVVSGLAANADTIGSASTTATLSLVAVLGITCLASVAAGIAVGSALVGDEGV